jgi:hypothetical protein
VMEKRIIAVRCTFETWIVRKADAILSEIPGTFTVEIRCVPYGKTYRLRAFIVPTLQPLLEIFPESGGIIQECMDYVKHQFKVQVGGWEEISA